MADDIELKIGAALDGLTTGLSEAKTFGETARTIGAAIAGYFSVREIERFVESMADLGDRTLVVSQISVLQPRR